MRKQKIARLPWWKRSIDVLGSVTLIILLLPIYAIVAIAIRLDSKGPIFYTSKRVGQGYRVFDFYKFRSMRTDADAKIKELIQQNQYATNNTNNIYQAHLRGNFMESDVLLVADGKTVGESMFLRKKKQKEQGTFFKMKDDPRITKVGKFIRSTSLDELPQLFNVLKGDMSLVGNRPLPLYEAEKLTGDGHILRFCAPAGITGLWQVKARGKSDMSEEMRKLLDVEYAKEYNLKMDLEILIKTPLAAVQEVNS